MTPEELAAIMARAGIGTPTPEHDCALQGYGCERCQLESDASAADVPALVAEVERLRRVEAAATLRAELDAAKADRDDVIRRNAQLVSDFVPLDDAIAHLASYCHARGYAEDCEAMQRPGSRSKFAATLWKVLSDAHADRKLLLSELDAARAALDKEREACDEWASLFDLNIGAFIHKDEGPSFRQLWSNDESVRVARKHRARRAAEAKE